MPVTKEFVQLPIKIIRVSDERQRSVLGDVEELAASMKSIGLLHPITINKNLLLIAGRRRLEAARKLRWAKISVQYVEELDQIELLKIELEENIKRKKLDWKDEAKAVRRLHDLYAQDKDDWEYEDTADAIGYSPQYVSSHVTAARSLMSGDEQVAAAAGISSARNIIHRRQQREVDSELDLMDEVESELEESPATTRPASKDILQGDFLQLAPKYKGRRFNFLHCDFPYGIGHDKSDQGGADRWGSYEDTAETYWALLKCLVENRDRFLTKSAHAMFWFSMENYIETVEYIRKAAPDFSVAQHPLVWHKSDNRGILPDPERGPRRTYETALFISRGDRRVVTPVANSYASPTAKSERTHLSQKPEPVLRYFFRLFVDENSECLDPTCGSGTSLVAAEDLGARRVLGWDIDKTYVEDARSRVNSSRVLRRVTA